MIATCGNCAQAAASSRAGRTLPASSTTSPQHAHSVPSATGIQLTLAVDGQEILEAEDITTLHTSGSAGLWMDFDAQIPQEQRAQSVFVWDNFEVRSYGTG